MEQYLQLPFPVAVVNVSTFSGPAFRVFPLLLATWIASGCGGTKPLPVADTSPIELVAKERLVFVWNADGQSLVDVREALASTRAEYNRAPDFVLLQSLAEHPACILSGEGLSVLNATGESMTYRMASKEQQSLPVVRQQEATLLLVSAELKDRSFHPASASSMRKAEARLLAGGLRETQQAEDTSLQEILLAVAMHEEPDMACFPILEAADLTALRVTDDSGWAWTHYDRESDSGYRRDYLFASATLASRFDSERSRLIELEGASHRLLAAVFRAEP